MKEGIGRRGVEIVRPLLSEPVRHGHGGEKVGRYVGIQFDQRENQYKKKKRVLVQKEHFYSLQPPHSRHSFMKGVQYELFAGFMIILLEIET